MTSTASVWKGLVLMAMLSWCNKHVKAGVGMTHHRRFVDIINNPNPLSADDSIVQDVYVSNSDVQELSLTQRLDHFAPSQGHTFEQHYFYSDRHVVLNNGKTQDQQQYAFLCVGGEGPALTSRVLVDSVHCSGDMLELASKLHDQHGISIHLFALEHRYYGNSYPKFFDDKNVSVSPVTNENLVYLSSRQALADLAHFVEQMTTKITSTTRSGLMLRTAAAAAARASAKVQWVTFGGSYPGMLAAWARLKYPHLIFAAVSNSAPIQAQLDMPSYNDKVAFDLQYPRIGGSQECLDIFTVGHAQLSAAIRKDKSTVATAFHLCDVSVLDDKGNVHSWIGDGVVQVPAQSNDPSCNGNDADDTLCNIARMCSYAIALQQNNQEPWETLAAMAKKQMKSDCLDVNWNQTLDFFADVQRGQSGGMRSWLWQTCTEFGFYQTCEVGSYCPFARGYHNLDEDFQICQYAFGIEENEVKDSIEQTKEYYGGRDLTGASRILSVNGDVDPWESLARVNSSDDLLPVYEVAGASHHFWTHPVKETDGDDIVKAREFIYSTVTKWLNLAGSKIDSVVWKVA